MAKNGGIILVLVLGILINLTLNILNFQLLMC